MSEMDKSVKAETDLNDWDRIADPPDEVGAESVPPASGLRERVRKLLEGAQQGRPGTKPELAKDRTRSLVLLIGGSVGAVLLFIGVFSAPTTKSIQQTGVPSTPNLGRAEDSRQAGAPRGSVTPLLSADVQSEGGHSDQLSPADIKGTSSRTSDEQGGVAPETRFSPVPRGPSAISTRRDGPEISSPPISDPLPAYRLNSAGTPTYSYGGASPASPVVAELPGPLNQIAAPRLPLENRSGSPAVIKSSIVFVRSTGVSVQRPSPQSAPATSAEHTLLPPGTRLLSRLDAAATTAVKMPVVASVEYNYERDGVIVVAAGSKIFGEIHQASPDGYLDIRFHSLQMPDGREEKIEGTSVALDQKPLRGEVSGKNTGKKILSRTLSGVGTIAAYVVGAGGAGLNGSITGETLLRDRVAGNIALAGEQELMSAAYSQNVSVTVPASTRFYVVLQKTVAVVSPVSQSPSVPLRSAEIPTVQELRELMDLKREINRMYQDASSAPVPINP
jgi:hypothetical protein